MRRLSIAFILAIFLPLICACGDEPRDYGDFLTDIVTYEGSSDDGTAMFSFQSRDDLPLQRLAASIKLPSDIVAGQRCLLRYTVVGNLADGTRCAPTVLQSYPLTGRARRLTATCRLSRKPKSR